MRVIYTTFSAGRGVSCWLRQVAGAMKREDGRGETRGKRKLARKTVREAIGPIGRGRVSGTGQSQDCGWRFGVSVLGWDSFGGYYFWDFGGKAPCSITPAGRARGEL